MVKLSDEDCEAISLRISAAQKAADHNPDGTLKSADTYRFGGLLGLHQELLPTLDVQQQYITWDLERTREAREPPQPPTPEEYFNNITMTTRSLRFAISCISNYILTSVLERSVATTTL
jgi:hypothetical protein